MQRDNAPRSRLLRAPGVCWLGPGEQEQLRLQAVDRRHAPGAIVRIQGRGGRGGFREYELKPQIYLTDTAAWLVPDSWCLGSSHRPEPQPRLARWVPLNHQSGLGSGAGCGEDT